MIQKLQNIRMPDLPVYPHVNKQKRVIATERRKLTEAERENANKR